MWQIYGQDHLVLQLEAGLKTGRLAHAYLLVGPPHVGKMALALNLAQAVNCLERAVAIPGGDAGGAPCGNCVQCQRIAQGIHADVKIVGVGSGEEEGPARRDIRIDQVREIESFLNLTSFEGSCKVVILDGAELLNTAAANALLKTLEEPPADALLLLLTANEDALLSTIRSRCRALHLKPVAKAELERQLVSEYAAEPELAERLARLSRGCLGQAVNALRDGQALEQREADLERLQAVCQGGLDVRFDYAAELATRFNRDREAVRELLYLWLGWWRDLLLIKEGAEEYAVNADYLTPLRLQAGRLSTGQVTAFIRRLNRTLAALDANANARLALETLLLGLPG